MIGEVIRKRRRECGISQVDLAAVMGIGQSTVAMWENGKNKPSFKALEKLADVLGLTPDELMCDGAPRDKRVPVLGRVQAGRPVTAVEDIIGYENISSELARHGEYFALEIRGDSMEPRMREGDVVIVRRQNEVENGEIAIVLVGNEDATCKKFYRLSGGVSLVSINPRYEPMFFSEEELKTTDIEVLGRVCELRARF